MKPDDQATEVRGAVIEVRPKSLYRVRLEDGTVITAGLTPSLRHLVSRLVVGDQILLRFSKHDPHRGQITRKAN